MILPKNIDDLAKRKALADHFTGTETSHFDDDDLVLHLHGKKYNVGDAATYDHLISVIIHGGDGSNSVYDQVQDQINDHLPDAMYSSSALYNSLKESYQNYAKIFGEVLALQATAPRPRVLITVSGGVAEWVGDEGVEVEKFDFDNYDEEVDKGEGVSAHFADLAEQVNAPIEGRVDVPSPHSSI